MSVAVRLPPEITRFLSLQGPQSLVIRGPPGSGKTTLATAMIESFHGSRLFVTSRVSKDDLAIGFPWLAKSTIERLEVIDASNTGHPVRDVAAAIDRTRHLLERPLDPGSGIERFLWLPAPIQEAWSRLPEDGASIVVIDSWDALVEKYLGVPRSGADSFLPDRMEIERQLLDQMAESRSHVILVLERDEPSHLDYLVNGVLSTSRTLNDGRLERWLQISKLRYLRVDTTDYPFTLEGGRFEAITPNPPNLRATFGGHDEEPDPIPGYVWPGSKAFAQAFGRLQLRRETLLDCDEQVPEAGPLALVLPVAAHVLQTGGRVLIVPTPGGSVEDIWTTLSPVAASSVLHQNLTIASSDGPVDPTDPSNPSLVDLTRPGAGEQMASRLRTLAAASSSGVNLVIAPPGGVDELVRALPRPAPGPDPGRPARELVHGPNAHIIVIARSSDPLAAAHRRSASIHLRLQDRLGRVLVYGTRPRTPGFVLIQQTGSRDSREGTYDLLRIV